MVKRKRHITSVISLWLLLVVVIAYLVSGGLMYAMVYRRQERANLERFSQVMAQNVAEAGSYMNRELLTQAVLYVDSLSTRLQQHPESEKEEAESAFRMWMDLYTFSEMDLVDASGVILASTDSANVGYDLHAHPALSEFLGLLDAGDGGAAQPAHQFAEPDAPAAYLDGATLNDASIVRYSAAKVPEMDALLLCGVTEQDQADIFMYYASMDLGNSYLGETGFYLRATDDLVVRAGSGDRYVGQTLPEMGFQLDPEREYLAEVEKQRINGKPSFVMLDNTLGYFEIGVYPMEEAMNSAYLSLASTLRVVTLVFGVLYFALLLLMKTVVLNKLAAVNKSLAVITSGNLNEKVNVRDTIEFASLSDDINGTVDRLKEYIAEAAARFDKDLEIAKEIQLSCLPDMDALPSQGRFTLAASMDPAKEVGGDFYDFYYLDEHTLALVIADVSGKSIPGAMYMMRSKALIKNRAQQGGSPAEIIADVNESLCEGNDAGMFVTVWFAVLDLDTGKGVAVNAGHEHPALRRGQDGAFELVKYRHSPAVATMEGIRFRQHEFELLPGDCLFVYTDGVAEATDAKPELYGEGRMLEALNQSSSAAPKEIIKTVKASIDGFVGEAEQFDDITMLCLEYFGPEK